MHHRHIQPSHSYYGAVATACGVDQEQIRSVVRTRKLTDIRVAIALQAIDGRVTTIREIAEYFGRDASGLSATATAQGGQIESPSVMSGTARHPNCNRSALA
jgi:hypothetical protein